MDIESYFERINKQELQEKEAREFRELQKREIFASMKSIAFTKKVTVATLIVSILSLLIAIFK